MSKKITISGSFRKFYSEILKAIDIFTSKNMIVLSPARSKIVNPGAEFAIFETDETTDVKSLEDKHLVAIRNSDYLYIVNPGGYVGKSAIFEMGYAVARNVPIFALEKIEDQTLAVYVDKIVKPEKVNNEKK